MPPVTLARNAMATRFEIVLHGENAIGLRAAGEEALDEIGRLEDQLSLYRPGSEIAQLNARAAREAVQVSPEVFALLLHARRLWDESGGTFDISIAPLVRCWGFMGGTGKMPSEAEVSAARDCIGMHQVLCDPATRKVRFAREGVMLDLGAIGKGYAVERAAGFLREAGVTSALIHGGTSTVCAIGHPPDAPAWNIALDFTAELKRRFPNHDPDLKLDPSTLGLTNLNNPFKIPLRDASLSISAASGRQFEFEGQVYGHVIDPRTAHPAEAAILTAVELPSATETDALSTALLTLGPAGQNHITSLRPGMKTMVVSREGNSVQASVHGW